MLISPLDAHGTNFDAKVNENGENRSQLTTRYVDEVLRLLTLCVDRAVDQQALSEHAHNTF